MPRTTLVYGCAVFFAVPAALAIAAAPIWVAWSYAGATSVAGGPVSLGLDAVGVYFLLVAVGSSFLKFVFPLCAMMTWHRHRTAAFIFGVMWLACLSASWGTMTVAAPAVVSIPSASTPALMFLAWSWLGLDVVASLMPVALSRPKHWTCNSPATVVAPDTPGTEPVATVERYDARPLSAMPRNREQELLDHLVRLSRMSPKEAWERGVRLAARGGLVTSQGTLASHLRVSKGTINRLLRALAASGSIVLEPTASETRITITNAQADVQMERSRTASEPADRTEQTRI